MESNITDLNTELCEEMSNYVEKLTTTGKPTLDEDMMKKFKKICKISDSYILHAYHLLMVQLCKEHAEIRRSAFQIIDQLFQRSHCFREKLVSEFQIFLELTVEIDPEQPLPPPKFVARTLKADALKTIQEWNNKFGSGYKKLILGYNFLKNCKMIDFNDIQARSVVERMREKEKERKKELHLQRKRERIAKEIEETRPYIDSCLVEAENCFQLVLPTPDSFFIPDANDDDDDDDKNEAEAKNEAKNNAELDETENSKGSDSEDNDFEDVAEGSSTADLVKTHGLGSATYSLTIEVNDEVNIKETDDNRDLLNNLKDNYCLICRKYLPTVTQWLQGLSQSGADDTLVKQVIDLKAHLTETKTKFGKLKFLREAVKNDPDSDDEDDFEEVEEKEGYEPEIPAHLRKEYGLDPIAGKSGQNAKKAQTALSKPLVKKYITSNMLKKPVKITPQQWNINAPIHPEDVADPTSVAATMAKWKKELEQKKTEQQSSTLSSKQDCQPSTSSGVAHPSTSQLRNQTSGDVKKAIIVGDKKKEEMLKKAPFVPFGPDLATWEDPNNIEAPMIIKYDSLHRFWAPNEAECVASEQDIALLKNRSFSFAGEFQPVKWKCRAPMPNGTLCPRMDRIKCPFHGKIVGRDNMGRPTNKEDAERLAKEDAAKNGWQDKELQKDIEAALGIDLGSDRDLCVEKGKGKGKGKGKRKKKKEERNLTDIKAPKNLIHDRLQKKLFNAATMKRVNSVLDAMDAKRSRDKFGNQFNYAHNHP